MNNYDIMQEQYENFEGDMRKLAELIGQLELWSDEYTINHKKEEVRLPQYIELHYNLEELKDQIVSFINEQEVTEGKTQYLLEAEKEMSNLLVRYKETEEVIHQWIREIKDLHILIAKSPILERHREYLEVIINDR